MEIKTFSISLMNEGKFAFTLLWRENARFEEKKGIFAGGLFPTPLFSTFHIFF